MKNKHRAVLTAEDRNLQKIKRRERIYRKKLEKERRAMLRG